MPWTQRETICLMNAVRKTIRKYNDTQCYLKRLHSVDWNSISATIVPPNLYSPEECEKRFKEVLKKSNIRCQRSLSEIFVDFDTIMQHPSKRSPFHHPECPKSSLSSVHLFVQEMRAKSDISSVSSSSLMLAKSMKDFKKLTQDQKNIYVQHAEKAKAQFDKQFDKFLIDNPPAILSDDLTLKLAFPSPIDLYMQENLGEAKMNTDAKAVVKSKKKYLKLSDEAKQVYIDKTRVELEKTTDMEKMLRAKAKRERGLLAQNLLSTKTTTSEKETPTSVTETIDSVVEQLSESKSKKRKKSETVKLEPTDDAPVPPKKKKLNHVTSPLKSVSSNGFADLTVAKTVINSPTTTENVNHVNSPLKNVPIASLNDSTTETVKDKDSPAKRKKTSHVNDKSFDAFFETKRDKYASRKSKLSETDLRKYALKKFSKLSESEQEKYANMLNSK